MSEQKDQHAEDLEVEEPAAEGVTGGGAPAKAPMKPGVQPAPGGAAPVPPKPGVTTGT
jgi:hypothetical protein